MTTPPRGPVDWARQQAAERETCGRPSATTITQQQLDALYERLDNARDAAALHRQGLLTTAELYALIEAAPNYPPVHNAGPSIRECADQDAAHWNDKYAGERQ